jgi:restriction system protein
VKKDLEVSLQCKKQSRPVGMNAVKEIIAGKQFHNTPFGAIITSRSFTDAAKKLAAEHGIFLLHHKSMARLEGMMNKKLKTI